MRSRCAPILPRALVALIATAVSFFALGAGRNEDDRTAYWASWAVTNEVSRSRGVDWAGTVDLSRSPLRRDAVVFAAEALGRFPWGGPHQSDNEEYMVLHLAAVRRDVAAKIPDPSWSGFAVIEYDAWVPDWDSPLLRNIPSKLSADAPDYDFKSDWEDYVQEAKPQALRGLSGPKRDDALRFTFNTAARDFFLATLRECKRLRPNAKWGFYGFPYREYAVNDPAPRARWVARNESLRWMYDASDVLYPAIHAVYATVEGRPPNRAKRENRLTENAEYITSNVREAVRLAAGKPVRPIVWLRYHDNAGPSYAFKRLTPASLRQMVTLPKAAGASGVMIWDQILSPGEVRELQMLVDQQLAASLTAITVTPEQAAAAPQGVQPTPQKAAPGKQAPPKPSRPQLSR
jgi:hypothetical protein